MIWTVAFVIVAAATVGPSTAKEIAERPSNNNVDDLSINNNELMSVEEAGWGLPAEREGDSINSTCEDVGGKCIPRKTAQRKGKGKKVRCIDGCPKKDGFFMMHNQCFKFFDKPYKWNEAKDLCAANNLVLARPFETMDLRNYLVLRYGVGDLTDNQDKYHRVQVWLNAQSDGKGVKWNIGTPGYISPDLPLWYTGHYTAKTGNCLLLTSNAFNWKEMPDKTLAMARCNDYRLYPLCELLM